MSKSILLSAAASAILFATLPNISPKQLAVNRIKSNVSTYKAKDFSNLLTQLKGFDAELLNMHFKLYQGYVKNTNGLLQSLSSLALKGKDSSYEYGALKRRLGWEFDGMRLHEYYFSNMGPSERDMEGAFSKMITKHFGSFEKWKQEYMATGSIRGIGWVILYYDTRENRLMNTWINEHDLGHLSGCIPLLVMDVWEHAYITQFGLDRMKYMETFFENINWKEVESRFAKAL